METPRISIHAPLAGCDHGAARYVIVVLPFQSTHPLRGATVRVGRLGGADAISIHAPLAGCDFPYFAVQAEKTISIHAPLAGCDSAAVCHAGQAAISIHAPLAGCDSTARGSPAWTMYFNPRTPCGVRLPRLAPQAHQGDFNPRTPCGVRLPRGAAPAPPARNFNPRTPCGVRPHSPSPYTGDLEFQSTHPLRGATMGGCGCCPHPPFQSTHPLRGATTYEAVEGAAFGFQSTHPLRGATLPLSISRIFCKFQSTHPLRGATVAEQKLVLLADISIHAPLAGCDVDVIAGIRAVFDFNPRTPCGVRLWRIMFHYGRACISIHAPLAGCDWAACSLDDYKFKFQSTHPLRGATCT